MSRKPNENISQNLQKSPETAAVSKCRGTCLRPIDAVIGANLRRLRKQRKISQTTLGRCLGVSFQQIQKYESGVNRLSISRALNVCAVFRMTLSDFLTQLLWQEPPETK